MNVKMSKLNFDNKSSIPVLGQIIKLWKCMKAINVFYFTLLSMSFSICNSSVGGDQQDHKVAMQFVKLVQKRYYFIQRLERPIRVLFYINEKLINKDKASFINSLLHHNSAHKKIIIEPGTALLFQNDVVRKYMKKIEQTQNIDALKDLWSDFLAYKYIESDSFVKETLKAIMLLYKNLLLNITLPNHREENGWLHTDEIDILLNNKEDDIHDNFSCILSLLSNISDQKDFLVNNNLMLYLIHRLHKSIEVLTRFNKAHLSTFWHCLYVEKGNNVINFQHESISQCVDLMIENKSFEPLFSLWRKFSSYTYIDDMLFLKEFVSLQYVIYSRMISCMSAEKGKSPSPQEIIELYDTIAGLPMPEALNSLDLLVEELVLIMEKYELDSQMSWTAWFKKYWWVPPVAVASFYLNFMWQKKALFTA